MCLFRIPKDEDIVFVDRRAPRRASTQIVRQRRSSHSHSRPVSRISETVIKQHNHAHGHNHGKSHRNSTSMSEIHRHSSSVSEIHRSPPNHHSHDHGHGHGNSTSMTEVHRDYISTPVPPTPKPMTPVPLPAMVATPPQNFSRGYPPPPPVSVAPQPPSPTQSIPPPSPSIKPASPLPSYRDLSPPRVPTPPDESRVELIKVEEEHWPPHTSHTHSRSHSHSHSHGRSSPGTSHVSRRKSRKDRDRERERGDIEELYIERERIIERGTPSPHPPSPSDHARRGSRGSETPEQTQSGYRTVVGTGWDDRERDRRPITPGGYRVVDGVGVGAGGRRGSAVGILNVHRERERERIRERGGEEAGFGGRRGSVGLENGARNSGRLGERERVVIDDGRRRDFHGRG